MIKKIFPWILIILLLFAGAIAMTQEFVREMPRLIIEDDADEIDDFEIEHEEPEPVRPPRWFRSNAGGMALEEIPSRYAALRNEYALVIDYTHSHDLPEFLIAFNTGGFSPEIRALYKNGEILRTQWILRDANLTTRVNAVFIYPEEPAVNAVNVSQEETSPHEAAPEEEEIKIVREIPGNVRYIIENRLIGFIEIFDENTFLRTEYRFSASGLNYRIDYEIKENLIISATVAHWEEEKKDFIIYYKDYYRYTRSLSLRAIERVFHRDLLLDDEPVRVSFPRRMMDAVNEVFLEGQRFNLYPEFFGDIIVFVDSRIIFENDERGRTLSQTLLDDDDEVIWIIKNTWDDDRITSTLKIEGDTELLAEFEYDSNGDLILERNFRNGVLERIVRSENNIDIEELYLDDILVLRAVWEDGRKISETRVR